MKPKVLVLLSFALALHAHAGSATWNLNPTSGDWNTAANWMPNTVPNGADDIATFGISNTPNLSLSDDATVDGIVFSLGASPFTVMTGGSGAFATLGIGDLGVVNNSDTTQNFLAAGVTSGGHFGVIVLFGAATAGGNTVFTATSASLSGGVNGLIEFFDVASAGEAIFIANGGTVTGTAGAQFLLFGSSTGGNGTLIANGGSASGAGGGRVSFRDHAKLVNATVIANPGSNGGAGGLIELSGKARGGGPRVEVFGDGGLNDANGRFNIAFHDTRAPDITIGSVEGSGEVVLGGSGGPDRNLIVGSNNLSTVYSGIMHGIGSGGILTKIGTGTLTLSGPNMHAGGTVIDAGVLRVNNMNGSATGLGPVSVNAGILGGPGIIAGAVTIGMGESPLGAFLEPSFPTSKPTRLTIQSDLTFKTDGVYTYRLDARRKSGADQVVANGVTVENGAQFSFSPSGNGAIPVGTAFVAISNTSAAPIAGTFANLADGLIFSAGRNKYQASYSGGDGNDLTLTVVP